MSETRIQTRTKFFAVYTGRSEFYSETRTGDKVVLTVETTVYNYDGHDRSSSHLSIQNLAEDSAHLGVRLSELTDISEYIKP